MLKFRTHTSQLDLFTASHVDDKLRLAAQRRVLLKVKQRFGAQLFQIIQFQTTTVHRSFFTTQNSIDGGVIIPLISRRGYGFRQPGQQLR